MSLALIGTAKVTVLKLFQSTMAKVRYGASVEGFLLFRGEK